MQSVKTATEAEDSDDTASFRWSRALLKMQHQVARAGGDLQKIMDAVVNGALGIMPRANGAVVELLEGDELVYRAASGTAAGRVGLRLKVAGSFSGLCLRLGEPLRCDEARRDGRVDAGACRALDLRSMIVVPLPHGGRTVGVLKVYSPVPGAFSDRDLLTAQLLAGPLTIGFASATEADAREARQVADRRFLATFEQAAVGIAHVSPDGRFLRVNAKFCAIAGYSEDQIVDLSFQDITDPADLDTDLGYLKSLVAGDIAHYGIEKRYIRADRSATWVHLTVSMVRQENGEPDFFVAVIEDINARKRAELESVHDPLTGLLNRRGALVRLERELGRSAHSGEPLVLAFLDLDGFKSVNDRHGHAAGDRLLQRIAQGIADTCRPGDIVARMGGDEFLVLLPSLACATARPVLQRLLDAVRAAASESGHVVTTSIGATCLHGGRALGVAEAVATADRLMYDAKQQGRDCFVLAD